MSTPLSSVLYMYERCRHQGTMMKETEAKRRKTTAGQYTLVPVLFHWTDNERGTHHSTVRTLVWNLVRFIMALLVLPTRLIVSSNVDLEFYYKLH